MSFNGMPRETAGKPAILAKAERWGSAHEVHSASVADGKVVRDEFLYAV